MILSDYDIEKRRQDYDKEIRSGAVPIHEGPNIIGNVTEYFFTLNAQGGTKAMSSVHARILKIGPPPVDPENDPFTVSLALPLLGPNIYVEEKDVSVIAVSFTTATETHQGICRFEDIDIVTAIVRAHQQELTVKKPGLQLVVNNPDKPVHVN